MKLKNKSVLITGGAGFIGSHLVEAVIKESPEKIHIVDNLSLGTIANVMVEDSIPDNLKISITSASDYLHMKEILLEYPVDVVFDLAIVPLPASLTQPSKTFRENVEIALTMCELARDDLFDTIVHFSSSEAYGTNISNTVPMNEEHPLHGTTTYAASKAAADMLLFSYYKTFGIDMSIIRPFNNYGPKQNDGSYAGVIPLTIKRILDGECPIINGDGLQTRDYLYVTDTVNAAIEIYNNTTTRGKVINVASGKEISIEYLIKTICRYMEYTGKIKYAPERIGDVRRHIANIYRAEDLIEFKPTISFEDGIKTTIDWYRCKD